MSFLCLCACVSVILPVSLCTCACACAICLSKCVCAFISVPVCLCPYIHVLVSVYLYPYVCVPLSMCLSPCACPCVSICLCPCVPLPVCCVPVLTARRLGVRAGGGEQGCAAMHEPQGRADQTVAQAPQLAVLPLPPARRQHHYVPLLLPGSATLPCAHTGAPRRESDGALTLALSMLEILTH